MLDFPPMPPYGHVSPSPRFGQDKVQTAIQSHRPSDGGNHRAEMGAPGAAATGRQDAPLWRQRPKRLQHQRARKFPSLNAEPNMPLPEGGGHLVMHAPHETSRFTKNCAKLGMLEVTRRRSGHLVLHELPQRLATSRGAIRSPATAYPIEQTLSFHEQSRMKEDPCILSNFSAWEIFESTPQVELNHITCLCKAKRGNLESGPA